jgi:serine/threonine protein phosphatase PrpC
LGAVFVSEGIVSMFEVAKAIEAGGTELQDRAEVFHSGSSLVVVVADGAGGMSGGAKAATHVVGRIKEVINSGVFVPANLTDFLANLDREMAAAGTFGETTCVLAVLDKGKIVGASVGDSGAWLISGPEPDDLTAAQIRKPLLGSGRAMPIPFARDQMAGTLLLASDGLLKYTSREAIASVAALSNLNEAAKKLVELVRYPSGALPDDLSLILARKR